MPTELFRLVKTATQTSPECSIRPVRSSFYPIHVVADGTFAAGSIALQVSPTTQQNDWQTLHTFSTAEGYSITDVWERVRAVTSGSFSSVAGVDIYLLPGA